MLQNQIYIGRITHKEASYPGEHTAIIDKELWDKVQDQLSLNRVRRRNGNHAKDPSLLTGLLHDEQGRRFTPSHATKSKRRYRYYVTPSTTLSISTPNQRAWRIPSNEIENLVKREVLSLLESTERLGHVLDLRSVTPEDRLKTYQAAAARARALKDAGPPAIREFLLSILARINVRDDALDLEIQPSRLQAEIFRREKDHRVQSKTTDYKVDKATYRLRIGTRLKRRGGEIRLVLLGDDQEERLPTPDPTSSRPWPRPMPGRVS